MFLFQFINNEGTFYYMQRPPVLHPLGYEVSFVSWLNVRYNKIHSLPTFVGIPNPVHIFITQPHV